MSIATPIRETIAELAPRPTKPLNIFQRKQAMVEELIGEKPDKKHGQGYMYFSIHRVRHLVAKAGVKHGVDVTPEVVRVDGELTCFVTMTNTDDPGDTLIKQYTFQNLPKDPANSYLTKYSYVTLFHLADEEDADLTMNAPVARQTANPPVTPRPDRDPVAGGSGSPTAIQQTLMDRIAALATEDRAAFFTKHFKTNPNRKSVLELDDPKAFTLIEEIDRDWT